MEGTATLAELSLQPQSTTERSVFDIVQREQNLLTEAFDAPSPDWLTENLSKTVEISLFSSPVMIMASEEPKLSLLGVDHRRDLIRLYDLEQAHRRSQVLFLTEAAQS